MRNYSLEGYITTTARGPACQTAQYGWVLEYVDSRGDLRTKEGFGEARGTKNAINIKALGDMLSHLRRPCRVHIHTDCRYLESVFKNNWLPSWAEKSWKNSTGQEVKNKDGWEVVWELATAHELTTAYDPVHSYQGWILREIEGRAKTCQI